MDRSVLETLLERSEENRVRLHMPGHKGRELLGDFWRDVFKIDVTELFDTDDLYRPSGMIKESQTIAAGLWGAGSSFYLPGSSTAGILAGVFSATQQKKTVVMARNCHKSVYAACDLAGADKVFVLPRRDPESGAFTVVDPEDLDAALRDNPDAALAVVTSPGYEGAVCDVAALKRVCAAHKVPLMTDEAHGAHLGISGVFGGSAVRAGSDVTVQSLHKTLPCLTQVGIAHLCADYPYKEEFIRYLSMLQSSSPSYLFIACADACVRLMRDRGKELLERWKRMTEDFEKRLDGLKKVRLFRPGCLTDPTKITLITPDGTKYLSRLADMKIDCEMALGKRLVLYTGLGTEPEDLDRAFQALKTLETEDIPDVGTFDATDSLPPRGVIRGKTVSVPAKDAAGMTSAEYIWAYPPGIPLVCPGEILEEKTLATLERLCASGARVDHSAAEDGIAVFDERA